MPRASNTWGAHSTVMLYPQPASVFNPWPLLPWGEPLAVLVQCGMEGSLKRNVIFFLNYCSSRNSVSDLSFLLQVQELFSGNTAIITSERQVSGCYFPFTDGQMEAFFLIYQLLCSKKCLRSFMGSQGMKDGFSL